MNALHLDQILTAIRAGHVCVPWDRVLTLPADESGRKAYDLLADMTYDSAPVCDTSGGVVGVVQRARLRDAARVGDVMNSSSLEHVVTADTPYRDLLGHLCRQPLLLVLDGRELVGILTPGDMGSAPGRTHFYLLLSALEIGAAEWVRRLYPDQRQALLLLSAGRREGHARLLQELQLQDEHLDGVAALGLVDLIRILGATPSAKEAAKAAELTWKTLQGLGTFRNDVMHPVRAFTHANGDGLRKLAEIDQLLVRFVALAEGVQEATHSA